MTTKLLLISIALGFLIAAATFFFHALTLSGSIAAFFTVFLTLYFAGFSAFSVLLFTFAVISVAGKAVKKKSGSVTADINEKNGARDGMQVFANGFPAVVCAVLMGVTGQNIVFFIGYTVAVAEALGDSLASDIGVLSRRQPRNILTLMPSAPGMSGAVSLLGTLSALVGITATALFTLHFLPFNVKYFSVMILVPMAGVTFDSMLGATVQEKRKCSVCGKLTEKKVHCGSETQIIGGIRHMTNDLVNLISNAVSAALAVLFLIL